MSRPATLSFEDKNGDIVEFVAEGFATPYNSFILIHAKTDLRRSIIVPKLQPAPIGNSGHRQ